MQDFLTTLRHGEHLSEQAVVAAAHSLLRDDVSMEDKVAFLRAMHQKGETPSELAGFVKVFLRYATKPALSKSALPCMDVCGTGGDSLHLFNVSTTASFVVAAQGINVAKHGNRAITSKSGGADVLQSLGVVIDTPPEAFGDILNTAGVGFLFAPLYHPAFKCVAPARRRLAEEGTPTLFNLIGPLLNPLRPTYQLLGLYEQTRLADCAAILSELGTESFWIVTGFTQDGHGMDEVSVSGPTHILEGGTEVSDTRFFTFHPQDVGMQRADVASLKGGDSHCNARILLDILEGRDKGPKRDMVLLNAAAALCASHRAKDMVEGIALAKESLESGAARQRLERLINVSQRIGNGS